MIDSLFDFSELTMRTYFEGGLSLLYSSFLAIGILSLFWLITRMIYKRYFSRYVLDTLHRLILIVLNIALLYGSLLLLVIPLSDMGISQKSIYGLTHMIDVSGCLLLSCILTSFLWPHSIHVLHSRNVHLAYEKWIKFLFLISMSIVCMHGFGLLTTNYFIDPNLIYSINIIFFTPLLALAIDDFFDVVLGKFLRNKVFIKVLSKNFLILFGLIILSVSIRYSDYVDLEILNIASLFIAVLGIQIAVLLRERCPMILGYNGYKSKYTSVISNILGVVIAVNFIGIAIYLSHYTTFKYLSGMIDAITTISVTIVLCLFVKYLFIDEIKIKHVDSTVSGFLGKSIIILIILFSAIFVLDDFNINTHPLLAFITAGGLAVALALQSSLANFAAGLWIVVFSPFKLKDKVIINSHLGLIVDIDFLYTKLQKFNGELVIIPNSMVLNSAIENMHRSKIYRLPLSIGLAYGSDIQKSLKIINEIIDKSEHSAKGTKNAIKNSTINTDQNLIYIKSFDDSSICIEFAIWISSQSNFSLVEHDLRMEIIKRFRAEKIDIPFNQLDVNIIK